MVSSSSEGSDFECQKSHMPVHGSLTRSSTLRFRQIIKRWFARWWSLATALSRLLKNSYLHLSNRVPSILFLKKLEKRGKEKVTEMIGAMEKGIAAAQVAVPPRGVYGDVDLRIVPKYLSFRASLLKNQLTQQYTILILLGLLVVHFIATRIEIYSLYGKLRSKEYILAPGVQDFTPASAQSVPDSYVADAVSEYLGQLGNVTAGSIEERYTLLGNSMSPQLQIKFQSEAADFKAKVKAENISELFTVTQKEIRATGDGYYQVTALGKRETYVNNEYIGSVDEAIEMVLQLVPPKSGKRWFLQINSLTRQNAQTFNAKRKY